MYIYIYITNFILSKYDLYINMNNNPQTHIQTLKYIHTRIFVCYGSYLHKAIAYILYIYTCVNA